VNAFALELKQVSHRFGDVVALANASMRVRRGSVHAVLGENGAGKTTLMRIAFGMIQLRPMWGEIRVDDVTRHFASPADAIAAGIGMVQQHPANVGALSVWENVVLGGAGRLLPRQTRTAVRGLIETLGFSLDVDARVEEMPVASQQRLEILKAIYRKARLLILDEPTAILAPEEATELYQWLRGFAQGGGTAVVVTHKLDEARRFTDDLTVLRAGRTVLQAGSASTSSEGLTQAMIGEALHGSNRQRSRAAVGDLVLSASGVSVVDERRMPVIRDANFEVRRGEIVGVAGIEGSGHHHLLLALAGRHPVTSGEIRSAGAPSFVPEDRHRDAVVLPFSLLENFAIRNAGRRSGRIPWKSMAAQVAELMSRFDVRAPDPATPMQALSGGNQQKFVLARELDDDPPLIIAENPTRGLDIRATAAVRDHLRSARERGAAIVLYSSDLDELLDLADRVLVVHGATVTEAPLERARIGALMLGAA
jgi:general nucleoside transport system ATP-binding protein